MSLTQQQYNALEYITLFQLRNGYSPSMDEIANGIGCAAKSRAHRHVRALVARGFIEQTPNAKRALAVLKVPYALWREHLSNLPQAETRA